MESLATRLLAARTEAGLTQTELARAAGLKNQSIVGSLESGYRKNSSHTPALAAALGVNALWLADGRGPRYPGEPPPAMPSPAADPRTFDPKQGKDGASLLRRFAELYREYEKLPAKEKALMDEALAQQAELRRLIKGSDD